MSLEIVPEAFPEYKRSSPTRLLAEAQTVEVAGFTILIAGANRSVVVGFLKKIAADHDWSKEACAPISIAFLKPKDAPK